MLDWNPQPPYTAEQLLQVIRILRDPENGCPWDKVQTHASIRKNFLEETCEALEAIDADDAVLLREELGDVLMQVVFHAAMEEERGRFTFEDVCRNVCEKLVFRHPNIFASSAAENAGINGWDALKNKEKGRTTLADELATVPATLPALMRAQKLQKRAAGHGLGQAAFQPLVGVAGVHQHQFPVRVGLFDDTLQHFVKKFRRRVVQRDDDADLRPLQMCSALGFQLPAQRDICPMPPVVVVHRQPDAEFHIAPELLGPLLPQGLDAAPREVPQVGGVQKPPRHAAHAGG